MRLFLKSDHKKAVDIANEMKKLCYQIGSESNSKFFIFRIYIKPSYSLQSFFFLKSSLFANGMITDLFF